MSMLNIGLQLNQSLNQNLTYATSGFESNIS